MNTVFKIPPPQNNTAAYHLLVEAGRTGISIVWYSTSPLQIAGIYHYQCSEWSGDSTWAQDLQKLLAGESLATYQSCIISYNFKEGMPVPNECFLPDEAEAMLSDVYGPAVGDPFFSVPLSDSTYIYRVPAAMRDALDNRFYGAATSHSNAGLAAAKKEGLYVVVYASEIKCVLTVNGQLQLIQSYPYKYPADVVYHLLNICNRYGISPQEVQLTLSGFIDKQSSLFDAIYKYFLQISFDEMPPHSSLADEIAQNYPPHYFSYLIHLISCAS